MGTVGIRGEFIRLDQLLKLADAVGGGGEAKLRVQEGEARVNGQVETRRGRKLVPGDRVDFAGETYVVTEREPGENS